MCMAVFLQTSRATAPAGSACCSPSWATKQLCGVDNGDVVVDGAAALVGGRMRRRGRSDAVTSCSVPLPTARLPRRRPPLCLRLRPCRADDQSCDNAIDSISIPYQLPPMLSPPPQCTAPPTPGSADVSTRSAHPSRQPTKPRSPTSSYSGSTTSGHASIQ